MIHTLNLTRGAITLLSKCLVQAGWYAEKDQAPHVYRAGQILDLPEMDLGDQPETRDERVKRAWGDEARVLNLTERQRDTVKLCIGFLIDKAALPPGPYTCALMRELGLAPKD